MEPDNRFKYSFAVYWLCKFGKITCALVSPLNISAYLRDFGMQNK